MPENKLTFRNCIRELLGFVRPYRIRLSIALFMIIVTNLTFALNPMMEGKITTQLASDGAKSCRESRERTFNFQSCSVLWGFCCVCTS